MEKISSPPFGPPFEKYTGEKEDEKKMPRRGRPRLIANKACGTKLYVDDLREVVRLAQAERRGTVSDTIRDLVHEALAQRRTQTLRGEEGEKASLRGSEMDLPRLESVIKEIRELLRRPAVEADANGAGMDPVSGPLLSILTEIVGFTITAEMKTHVMLQNYLMSRGVSEEMVKTMIAETEAMSRKNTDRIISRLRKSEAREGGAK